MNPGTQLAPPVELPDEGRLYKHYKGDYYRVITCGRLSEERETWMVAYRSLERGHVWMRPLMMFVEPVVWPDGKTRPRFTAAASFADRAKK